jgi:hypothetical protein
VKVLSKLIKVFADVVHKLVFSWGQTLNNLGLQLAGFHGLVSVEKHAHLETNYNGDRPLPGPGLTVTSLRPDANFGFLILYLCHLNV